MIQIVYINALVHEKVQYWLTLTKNFLTFLNRGPPREGANVCGLYMEGARWDTQTGGIVESKVKELFPMMPVIYIKAITQVCVTRKHLIS